MFLHNQIELQNVRLSTGKLQDVVQLLVYTKIMQMKS